MLRILSQFMIFNQTSMKVITELCMQDAIALIQSYPILANRFDKKPCVLKEDQQIISYKNKP